jgi:thiol-disulfide isomerase/thioredoxin
MRKFIAIGTVLLLAMLGGCQKETTSTSTVKTTEKSTVSENNGLKAYDFSFTDVNGKKHRLSDFKGKVVIVQFFGTYCPPCRVEMPVLDEIYKKYKDKVVVIGLAVDYTGAPPEELKPFAEKMGVSYLIGPSPDRAWNEYAAKITGLDSIPQTFIIDKNGYVRYYEVGFAPYYRSLFIQGVEKLLNEK